MRRLLLLFYLTFLSWTVFAGKTDGELHVGDPLPVFSVTSNLGKSISNTNLRGKVCVIVFFHTRCWHCKHELPVINELYIKYGSQVNFLCISRGENDSSVSNFWDQHQLSIPYSSQEDRRVFNLFAERTIPRVYICDATGVIKAIFVEKVKRRKLVRCLEKEINKNKT